MRRARFARAVENIGGEAQTVSIREALWFGVRAPETSDEASLSDWRVGGLDHVALLLGVTHLLIVGACSALFADAWYRPFIRQPLDTGSASSSYATSSLPRC